MTRIFSTEFCFNLHTYLAIVTVTGRDGEATYTIRLLDDALRNIIPEGMLTYDKKEGFSPQYQNRRSGPLLKAISEAIRLHVVS